jgi:hypothetical protein
MNDVSSLGAVRREGESVGSYVVLREEVDEIIAQILTQVGTNL